MDSMDRTPLSLKSAEELAAISRWLSEHVQDLCLQNAAIQAELRRRSGGIEAVLPPLANANSATPSRTGAPGGAPGPIPLAYRVANIPVRVVGDAYAEEARRYAMKVTLIAGGVGVALVGLLCIAAQFG